MDQIKTVAQGAGQLHEWVPQEACPGRPAIYKDKDERNGKGKISLCISKSQAYRCPCPKDPKTGTANAEYSQHHHANGSDYVSGVPVKPCGTRPNGNCRSRCESVEPEPREDDDHPRSHSLQGKKSA